MKMLVHYTDGRVKEIEIEKLHIIQGSEEAPYMINMHSTRDKKLIVGITSSVVPGESFLKKIEIVQ